MKNIELSIDMTYKCLYSCPFCSSQYGQLLPDITKKTAIKCNDFLNKNYNKYSKYITITGGEPLVLRSKKVSDLISIWTKNGINVRMCTTAGVNVRKEKWKLLKKSGLQTIFLSLNDVNDCNQNKVYGNNYSFQIVTKNIDMIKENDIELIINFVLTKLNYLSFYKLLEFCLRKKIRKIRILGLARQGNAIKNWNKIALSTDQERKILKKYLLRVKNYPIELEFAGLPNYKRCTHTDEYGNCMGGKFFFHINTIGEIFPCPSVKSISKKKIGTLYNYRIIGSSSKFPCNTYRKNNCYTMNEGV